MNDVDWRQHQASSAPLRLPAEFTLPLSIVVNNVLHGTMSLIVAGIMLIKGGSPWMPGTLIFGVFGGLVLMRNIPLLSDPSQRKWILRKDGIEVQYGLVSNRYRFVDYTDFRISSRWFGQSLIADPIETEWRLRPLVDAAGKQLTRSAILAPGPPLGGGAPATLLEWQATLNTLRRDAVAGANLTASLESRALEQRAEEASRMAEWRVLESRGARPSRLSRKRYENDSLKLAGVSIGLLIAPMAFAFAAVKMYCGLDTQASCIRFDPAFVHTFLLSGPVLGFIVLKFGKAWLMVRRAHDLDEDLSYWAAVGEAMKRRRQSILQQRLSEEDGTLGANRFGPQPLD